MVKQHSIAHEELMEDRNASMLIQRCSDQSQPRTRAGLRMVRISQSTIQQTSLHRHFVTSVMFSGQSSVRKRKGASGDGIRVVGDMMRSTDASLATLLSQ